MIGTQPGCTGRNVVCRGGRNVVCRRGSSHILTHGYTGGLEGEGRFALFGEPLAKSQAVHAPHHTVLEYISVQYRVRVPLKQTAPPRLAPHEGPGYRTQYM